MPPLPAPYYSPEQYLELERSAEFKSEYMNGQILAMSGASREHNLISLNTGAALQVQLRGRRCEAYVADMRVKIEETGMYAYPDVVVVCGPRRFEDSQVDTLTNPTVLIEVLSRSTEAYDRGAKAAHFRRIESLQEIVFIAQDRISVERFTRIRQDQTPDSDPARDLWELSDFMALEDEVPLRSIGCTLRLRDVYDRVIPPSDGE